MNSKNLYLLVMALIFVGLLAGPQISPAAEPKTLTWGLTASLSGPGAYWGVGCDNGARLAIEDINAKGGVTVKGQRYNFAIKSYDHEFRPDKNLELMHRLVESDKVDFIWTHGAAATVACLPYYAEVKKIVFHIAAGVKMLSDPKGSYYCFKTLDDPPVTTRLGLQYIREKYPNVKKIFDISPDNESGWDNSSHTQRYGKQFGMEVKTEYYPRGQSDFYPIITRGLAWNPDMITPSRSDPASLANILKQSRELGFKGLFYSESPYSFDSIKDAAGKHIEGWIFVNCSYLVPGFETAGEKEFKEKYIKKYGGQFNEAALTAAQGIYILAETVQKAQTLETDNLIKFIETSKFSAAGRRVSFVGKSVYPFSRQSNTGVIIVQVKDGKQVPLSQVIYLPDDF